MKRRIFTTLFTVLCISSCLACNKQASTPSEPVEDTYSITINQVSNGTISVNKSSGIKEGETINLRNIPDQGYELYYYLIDGQQYKENTFVMPSHNVTVSGLFGDGMFNINCEYNDLIYFDVENKSVYHGEKVTIEYMPVSDYVLSYFLVNDKKIEGDTFTMPFSDVTIKAVAKKAYVESDYYIDLLIEGRDEFNTRSNWFFEYGEKGLNIKVIVKDHFIVDNYDTVFDIGYRDNIEFVLSPLENVSGLSTQKSINILVSADGGYWFRRANSDSSFIDATCHPDFLTTSSKIHHYLDKEGFEGYVVDVFVDYRLFNLNKDNAQFVVCPSFRNTINYPYKTYWGFYQGLGCDEYLNISHHPLINRDGSLSQNPYLGGE